MKLIMEILCLPGLSEEQPRNLPEDYLPPPIEGMCSVDDKYPEGIIFLYVSCCDWENNFDGCLREFVLTIFHETMHVVFPELEKHIPYAEKICASALNTIPSKDVTL